MSADDLADMKKKLEAAEEIARAAIKTLGEEAVRHGKAEGVLIAERDAARAALEKALDPFGDLADEFIRFIDSRERADG